MSELRPQIKIHHTNLPSPLPSSPSFQFQLTRLTSTLVVWVGAGPPTQLGEEVSIIAGGEKKLASDWSVAMPARGNIPVTATPIFRSGASDIALPMSQRLDPPLALAPPSLTSQSGPSLDPYASKVLLAMEKKLGNWLSEVLKEERGQV